MNSPDSNTCAAVDTGCGCTYGYPVSLTGQTGKETNPETGRRRAYLWATLSLGAIIYLAGLLLPLQGLPELFVFSAAYLLWGGGVLLRAGQNIIRGVIFDENFLMSVATLGAFAIGEYPEGVAVMVFYRVGEMLQDRAVDRSRRSVRKLMDIRPDYARLKQGDDTIKVSPEQVEPGDIIVVNPGERIPLDGRVLQGSSALDVSALTGESLPRMISEGDEILSGSVNKTGMLAVEVTREYRDSTVNRILYLVESASGRKAKTERFITRFARYYTPAVVGAAVLLALLPPLLITGQDFSLWFYRALVFLVISCPCALVISIPLGFIGGIGGASRRGILVKGGNYLEALGSIDTVVFDKTGTLTRGTFEVTGVYPSDGFTEEQLLGWGAAAATHTSHPVAAPIFSAGSSFRPDLIIGNFGEIPGQGVRAETADRVILMGSGAMMREQGIQIPPGNCTTPGTPVYLAVDGTYAGTITVSDEIKEDSASAVQRLKNLGVRNTVMLTGDRYPVAEETGRKIGLDRVFAELLPHHKVEKIEQLIEERGKGKIIAFVGDGINDAPALARADIGIAMGGIGSDAALEAADVVLMTGEPSKLAEAVTVARKTRSIVIQNVVLALGIKGLILIMGAAGLASMWEAVFADVGVALLAVLNATRAIK